MDILEVVELSDAPSVPVGYKPKAWALAVAAELERLKGSGVKAVLVHLEDAPRVRTVGPSRPLTQ